ncbi:MAG: hypothetical protein HYT76_07470 [Deltaproteobacteria bacterium]|nr:hypothetical protein [Deltaproteobacteria bacterium]
MAETGGINPLKKAFEAALVGDGIVKEGERAAIEAAVDSLATSPDAIEEALHTIYWGSGVITPAVLDPLKAKLQAAGISTATLDRIRASYDQQTHWAKKILLPLAKDGLTTDELKHVFNTGDGELGLRLFMNHWGVGAINLFLDEVITLASSGTKIWIEEGGLVLIENQLVSLGVRKELIDRALKIKPPEKKQSKESTEERRRRIEKEKETAEAERQRKANEEAERLRKAAPPKGDGAAAPRLPQGF